MHEENDSPSHAPPMVELVLSPLRSDLQKGPEAAMQIESTPDESNVPNLFKVDFHKREQTEAPKPKPGVTNPTSALD